MKSCCLVNQKRVLHLQGMPTYTEAMTIEKKKSFSSLEVKKLEGHNLEHSIDFRRLATILRS